MAQSILEKRVAVLEQKVAGLKERLSAPARKDWRRTLGMFTDDPEMIELFDDAIKIREEDRRRTRPKARRKRKSRA